MSSCCWCIVCQINELWDFIVHCFWENSCYSAICLDWSRTEIYSVISEMYIAFFLLEAKVSQRTTDVGAQQCRRLIAFFLICLSTNALAHGSGLSSEVISKDEPCTLKVHRKLRWVSSSAVLTVLKLLRHVKWTMSTCDLSTIWFYLVLRGKKQKFQQK